MKTSLFLVVMFLLVSVDSKCPEGAVFHERTEKCLHLIAVRLTHFEAETSCLSLQGTLALIDRNDRALISGGLFNATLDQAWIASKSRNRSCSTVDLRTGDISPKKCDSKHAYICQRPLGGQLLQNCGNDPKPTCPPCPECPPVTVVSCPSQAPCPPCNIH
ncbi:hypothetical protein QR680_004485 [Steinernema hermaphroditum]|uniref:C-type lectin domain-containing protein n=1 Tax=Steinernema hermaphroditum TaxID=289476 RepID=A0AA39HR34_9BILA|nr:hypothetical protein QR680_004485 [Steinernema hermaphroditum]